MPGAFQYVRFAAALSTAADATIRLGFHGTCVLGFGSDGGMANWQEMAKMTAQWGGRPARLLEFRLLERTDALCRVAPIGGTLSCEVTTT